eukprot:scaffold74604_cov30-Tisochrysis_lutea.AAC.2
MKEVERANACDAFRQTTEIEDHVIEHVQGKTISCVEGESFVSITLVHWRRILDIPTAYRFARATIRREVGKRAPLSHIDHQMTFRRGGRSISTVIDVNHVPESGRFQLRRVRRLGPRACCRAGNIGHLQSPILQQMCAFSDPFDWGDMPRCRKRQNPRLSASCKRRLAARYCRASNSAPIIAPMAYAGIRAPVSIVYMVTARAPPKFPSLRHCISIAPWWMEAENSNWPPASSRPKAAGSKTPS